MKVNEDIKKSKILFDKGLKLAQLGNPNDASKLFEEAAWLDPENPKIQFNLGTAHLSLGNFEQAIINLSNDILLDNKLVDAYGNRCVAYYAIGEDENSSKDFKKAKSLGANEDGLMAILDYVKTKRRN